LLWKNRTLVCVLRKKGQTYGRTFRSATTAEKLKRTMKTWDVNSLPFHLPSLSSWSRSPVVLFAPTAVAPTFFLHQFPSPLTQELLCGPHGGARPLTVTCLAQRRSDSHTSCRNQIHLVLRLSKVGGDACHRSNRVVLYTCDGYC